MNHIVAELLEEVELKKSASFRKQYETIDLVQTPPKYTIVFPERDGIKPCKCNLPYYVVYML